MSKKKFKKFIVIAICCFFIIINLLIHLVVIYCGKLLIDGVREYAIFSRQQLQEHMEEVEIFFGKKGYDIDVIGAYTNGREHEGPFLYGWYWKSFEIGSDVIMLYHYRKKEEFCLFTKENASLESIQFNVLQNTNLYIEKQRIKDEFYGVNHLNNRWNLEETDSILSAIKGYWKPDEYKGFVSDSLYYPDLFVDQETLGADVIEKLLDDYNQKVLYAQNNIPDVTFSVKEKNGGDVESNYIYTNGIYPSPVGIILSLDRMSDFYPAFSDRTTISKDIIVEYPVLYIQFFLICKDEKAEDESIPATLVISSDNQFLILIDGAYYTLKAINR